MMKLETVWDFPSTTALNKTSQYLKLKPNIFISFLFYFIFLRSATAGQKQSRKAWNMKKAFNF